MADDDAGARQWIVEPPSPDEVIFHVSIGERVELTEDQERALSEFLESLETSDAEVTGFGCSRHGTKGTSCTKFSCSAVNCPSAAPRASREGLSAFGSRRTRRSVAVTRRNGPSQAA